MQLEAVLAVLDLLKGVDKSQAALKRSKDPRVVDEVAKDLVRMGMIETVEGDFVASLDQRMNLAYLALSLGGRVERVSRALSWRDFEEFTARIFASNGYEVETHLVFKKPRFEVDLAAWTRDYLISVDCKHWSKPLSESLLRSIVEEQVERSRLMIRYKRWIGYKAYPCIVTLQPWKEPFYRRVPIVAVNLLNNFLIEFPSFEAGMFRAVATQIDIGSSNSFP